MTFEQAFLKIKEKFNNADASKTSDFAIQITFTDEDCGGTFYAEVKDGKLAVEPYDYYDNDTVLDISKSALLALIAGRTSLDKAIADGEASVKGDASKIADLKNTIKKAPAKSAEPKKAPAKKAETKAAPAKKAAAKPAPVKKPETKAAAPAVKKAEPVKPAEVKAPVKSAKKTTAK
jgi:hypothetical protein